MPTTCLRAQPSFSVHGQLQLMDRATSPATSSRPKYRALLELNLDITENVSTPTQIHESAESDANSDSENFQFSKTLGKYVAYLKSIKRPKVVNSELLDGVDRVSRSIEGCIKLAESTLGSSKTQQNSKASNPHLKQMGDMFSGIDRVDSSLIDCINMAESTLQ